MAKKTKYSNAGKGDKSRVKDKKKYDKNYDRILTKDVGLSDTHHKGIQKQKTQIKTTRKN